MSNIPKIEPIKVQEFEVKQSKYEMVGKLPTRAILCAPSGGGRTVLLSNLILDVYRGCFSRVYIFSPSIDIDYTWAPVKKYIEHEMKAVESDDDKFYFSEYDSGALENIIETQHKITNYMKKHLYKTLFQISIVIDILQMILVLQDKVNYYLNYMFVVVAILFLQLPVRKNITL